MGVDVSVVLTAVVAETSGEGVSLEGGGVGWGTKSVTASAIKSSLVDTSRLLVDACLSTSSSTRV